MDKASSVVDRRIAQDKEFLLEHLRTSAIVEIACQKAEVGRSTYYRYRQQDPEFAKAADEALHAGTLLMNDRAEGYLLSAIQNKNMSAITLWLKTHHPAYSHKLEITGSMKFAAREPTPEELKAIELGLQLTALVTKENIEKLNEN